MNSEIKYPLACISLMAGLLRSVAAYPQAEGYTGIWYMNQASGDEYKFKYSGGFATYPQQHIPLAIYCAEVKKTFFCYGGTTSVSNSPKRELLHMVSYFDHVTKEVPRPTILLNKHTNDAHDNPTIALDDHGFIYIFSPSHGTGRPSFIHRSKKPYDITDFEQVMTGNFSYSQPWFVPGEGFLFLHTRYADGRNLFFMTSQDAKTWSKPQRLARIGMGDYQISWRSGSRIGSAFDFHPAPLGLNGRANIYYLETADYGKSWRTVEGRPLDLPVADTNNPALVYDSRKDGLLVYLKDLAFDAKGRPVILFLTSKGYESGPKNGPRQWQTVRWTGEKWERRPFTTSESNYDHGSLYIEEDGTWRVIAPTARGPQPYNPGGEMVMWLTHDEGLTWSKKADLTKGGQYNHTYARRPFNAQPDFYGFWADGNPRAPSDCSIYFTDKKGDHVWRLPRKMEGQFAKPELAW